MVRNEKLGGCLLNKIELFPCVIGLLSRCSRWKRARLYFFFFLPLSFPRPPILRHSLELHARARKENGLMKGLTARNLCTVLNELSLLFLDYRWATATCVNKRSLFCRVDLKKFGLLYLKNFKIFFGKYNKNNDNWIIIIHSESSLHQLFNTNKYSHICYFTILDMDLES